MDWEHIKQLINERQMIDEELANLFAEFIAKHDKEEHTNIIEFPQQQ